MSSVTRVLFFLTALCRIHFRVVCLRTYVAAVCAKYADKLSSQFTYTLCFNWVHLLLTKGIFHAVTLLHTLEFVVYWLLREGRKQREKKMEGTVAP